MSFKPGPTMYLVVNHVIFSCQVQPLCDIHYSAITLTWRPLLRLLLNALPQVDTVLVYENDNAIAAADTPFTPGRDHWWQVG
jgi:hypothetical protein